MQLQAHFDMDLFVADWELPEGFESNDQRREMRTSFILQLLRDGYDVTIAPATGDPSPWNRGARSQYELRFHPDRFVIRIL